MRLRTLIIVLLLIVIALQGFEPRFLGISYSGASPLNPRWDGTTKLAELARRLGYEVRIVHSWFYYLLQVPREKCGIAMLISPERPLPPIELLSLVSLIETLGYNLVVADEGPYSMPLLKSLGIDIEIDSNSMLPSIVTAEARISGKRIQIVLDYASPLIFGSRALSKCRGIVMLGGKILGAVCRTGKSSIVVIGDGTIFTNAALKIGTLLNPDARFLEVLLRELCPRGGILAIDASSYSPRVASVNELEDMGYRGSKLLQALLAPSRALKPAIHGVSLGIETSIGISVLASLIVLLTVLRIIVRVAPQARILIETRVKPRTIAKSLAMLASLCEKEDIGICSDVMRSVFRKPNIDRVESLMRSDVEVRRKILKTIECGQREVASTSRCSESA